VVYVVEGTGTFWSRCSANCRTSAGDYVVIHRNITIRWRLDAAAGRTKFLVMESRGHVRCPSRYRNDVGQMLEGAPFCERDIRRPHDVACRTTKRASSPSS
jgi:homogentisate 1,2-dioxygenase